MSKFVNPYESPLIIDSNKFNNVISKLRSFFLSKNFVEVCTQNRLSILAACEDPFNVATFNYAGNIWPLPQTGQMWLEYEILKNPEPAGYFCLTTSYRLEPNPVEGRHDIIFPLFEFETKGTMEDLILLQVELLEHLGYDMSKIDRDTYKNICNRYNVDHTNNVELDHDHETKMCDNKQGVFITDFPEYTHPFWNMRRNNDDTAFKVDVILGGMETFGSAERENDVEVMRDRFNTIMDGAYKRKLFELFGEERTLSELDEYFKLNFIPRVGCGIGVTRLIKSMEKENLL
jgi:aspartyl/asparaginyl-tRNA synthetase